MHRRQGLLKLLGVVGLTTAVLPGCAGGAVQVPAAQRSTDPVCSSALVAVRGATTVNGQPRRETTSQATAAWGPHGEIQLRCGLPALPPTTDRCQTVGEVDWVITQSTDRTIFTAYGRNPTASVSVAGLNPAGVDEILTTLAPAAAALPDTGHKCL